MHCVNMIVFDVPGGPQYQIIGPYKNTSKAIEDQQRILNELIVRGYRSGDYKIHILSMCMAV